MDWAFFFPVNGLGLHLSNFWKENLSLKNSFFVFFLFSRQTNDNLGDFFFLFFSKFLIILAKSSFENWPIFPLKNGKLTIFIKIFNVFKLYFSKKLWEFDHFWPIFQKKIPRNHQFFSKSSRFHALCSKIFRKLTFFPWKSKKFENLAKILET